MNFKKQVMRYRRIADQKIGRANKSEVLSEEMLQIEKRLEHTRLACQSVYKRISQCLQSSGPDLEKRLKKLPETAVAHAMTEASQQMTLDSENALQKSLKVCAEAETGVARERAIFEMFVEGHVVNPLHTLVETDIPNTQKLRERLKRLVLDRDNASSAWQKAHKEQYKPGVNIPQMSVKADAMKEELDAATSRMEQCKDQLITELFDFISKEGTYAQHVTDFVAKELEYHRKCVAHLEKLEPEIRAAQENANVHSSYGTSLADHLYAADREIALPIESCITCLLEIGMYEEGLFRVAGGAAKLKKFRALAGAGVMDLASYDAQDDVHAVAGALKQYLRELPVPLLTQELYNEWISASSISDNDKKLQRIWSLVDQLPKENKDNLGYLIHFCHALASKQEHNKMSAGNIALVFAPNLLWAPTDDITANMMVSNSVAAIIESMINYVTYFFPDGPDFKAPPTPQSVEKNNAGHGRSPSSGSAGESHPATNHSNPPPPKSPSHSRTSSSDTNISAVNHQTSESTLGRKKKKAPAAPSGPPPAAPTGPSRVSPTPSGGDGATTPNKPPVASKRTSTRRPATAPPPPPPGGTNAIAEAPPPKPQPKPKPVMRKKPTLTDAAAPKTELSKQAPSDVDKSPPPPPEDFPPPIPEEEVDAPPPDSAPVAEEEGPLSPPMPDLPPPPLPSEIEEAVGPDLSSELSSTQVVAAPKEQSDDEDGDFIVTSL